MAVIETEHRGNALLLGINRPEKRNALDENMVDELHKILDQATKGEPRVLIVYSQVPGIFVSGADIGELLERDGSSALRAINAGLFEKLEAYRWPSIAVIDGPALGGGCELALACDFRVASPRARFGQPELNLGILAGAGGNWRLPQLVGIGLARRMLYLGEVIDSAAALEAGLVDQVFESDQVLQGALGLAELAAKRSWRALELTKLALASHRPATTRIDMVAQALLFESEEKRERMRRFLNKQDT